MYTGVPSLTPSTVRVESAGAWVAPCGSMLPPVRRAMPKSSTFTRPSSARTITFSGLMSRWMSPRRCAPESARATSAS